MDNKLGLVLMLALVGIVVLAAVLLASSDPFNAGILQAQGEVAAAPMTVSAAPLSGLWLLATKSLIVLAGIVLIGGLAWFAYQKTRSGASQRRWAGGSNARLARPPRVKPLTLKEMVEMQFYRTFLGERQPQVPSIPEERQKVEF